MNNNSYYDDCEGILRDAEERHQAWLKKDPARNAQLDRDCAYSSPYRPPQPNWGSKGTNPNLPPPSLPSRCNKGGICPRCKGTDDFKSETVVEGCRMNGDGYGRSYSICPECGWVRYAEYDEAN